MRRLLLALALLLAAPVQALTRDEVVSLCRLDMPPQAIVCKMYRDGAPAVGRDDLVRFRKLGVPEVVLTWLVALQPGAPATVPPHCEPNAPAELPAPATEIRAAEERAGRKTREQSRVAAQLQAAEDLARSDHYAQAIARLAPLLENDGDVAADARYVLGRAFAVAGMHQSAALAFTEVVRQGPQTPHFAQALAGLRAARREIEWLPVDLANAPTAEMLAAAEPLRSEIAYVLGQLRLEQGRPADAAALLTQVQADAPDHARARFLMGVALMPEEGAPLQAWRQSLHAWQDAAREAEAAGQTDLMELAWLQLGRAAYEMGRYDLARYAYHRLPNRSRWFEDAFIEQMHLAFLAHDDGRLLGAVHAIHGPYFQHRFVPEAWGLEAVAYLHACQTGLAEAAMRAFAEDVGVLGPAARDTYKRGTPAGAAYAVVLRNALPKELRGAVLQERAFRDAHRALRQIQRERAALERDKGALGTFATHWQARLQGLEAERAADADRAAKTALLKAMRGIEWWQDAFDPALQPRCCAATEPGRPEPAGPRRTTPAPQEAANIAGNGTVEWPYEGEAWRDEITAYRGTLENRCPRPAP